MRHFFPLIIFMLLLSCDEKIFTAGVDCDECFSAKFDSVDLIIDITVDDKYTSVPWKLFREEVEKDALDWVDTASISPIYIAVSVNREYSVKVEYAYDEDTIFVIDATTIKWKRVSDECDDECYVLVNNRINARLKY